MFMELGKTKVGKVMQKVRIRNDHIEIMSILR